MTTESGPYSRRRLAGPNPFIELDDGGLSAAAARLAEELLMVSPRSPAERRALADQCAYLLLACKLRLSLQRDSPADAGGVPKSQSQLDR